MNTVGPLLAAMLILLSAPLFSQPPEQELSALLDDLTSTDFDAREKASTRLVAMAPGTEVSLTTESEDGARRSRSVKLLDEGRRVTRASVPILTTYTATADRSRTSFVLLDLYVISLVRYSREGGEKQIRVLRFFEWNTGVGELDG